MNILKYSDIVKQISPLDLLLFKGVDCISKTIRIVELISGIESKILEMDKPELKRPTIESKNLTVDKSKIKDEPELENITDISHYGIVVTSELLPSISQLIPGRFYVWESTIDIHMVGWGMQNKNLTEVITSKGKFDVQIRDLEDILKAYMIKEKSITGNIRSYKVTPQVIWYPLKVNPWSLQENENPAICVLRRVELIKNMKIFYRKFHDRPYENNCLELLGSTIPCLRPYRDDLTEISVMGQKIYINKSLTKMENTSDFSVFCSDFVAILYQTIGLLDKKYKTINSILKIKDLLLANGLISNNSYLIPDFFSYSKLVPGGISELKGSGELGDKSKNSSYSSEENTSSFSSSSSPSSSSPIPDREVIFEPLTEINLVEQ